MKIIVTVYKNAAYIDHSLATKEKETRLKLCSRSVQYVLSENYSTRAGLPILWIYIYAFWVKIGSTKCFQAPRNSSTARAHTSGVANKPLLVSLWWKFALYLAIPTTQLSAWSFCTFTTRNPRNLKLTIGRYWSWSYCSNWLIWMKSRVLHRPLTTDW